VQGLHAWLRSLSTLIAVQASKYEEAAMEGKTREAWEVLAILSKGSKRKEFIYKKTFTIHLVDHNTIHLVDHKEGTAVVTHRKLEEERAQQALADVMLQ
jgi:hypothetical protein